LWVILGVNYKAMRIRDSSKRFRLMPISLNLIKLQFKSVIYVLHILKIGDFFAFIKDLCMPFTHRKPGRTLNLKGSSWFGRGKSGELKAL